MAERLACDLCNQGLSIISGLARGVDTAAHRGVINAKGWTVGVMGTGVDENLSAENKRLAEQILALGGTLISEFAVALRLLLRIFQFGTVSSVECPWACWLWKPLSIVVRESRRAAPSNKVAKSSLCRAT